MLPHVFAPLLLLSSGLASAAGQPNIVFILTDDQDKLMESVDYMPQLNTYVRDKGTTYPRHYCTIALCCPSRVNLWTGRAAHNTNVTDVIPPYGGYDKVVSNGINDDYLPIWMQNAGYNTYYTGKLWNHFNAFNYRNPPAKGWTGSDISVDPSTYRYFNTNFSRNGEKMVNYEGQYAPDVVASKALGFLDDAIADEDGKPFFLVAAPIPPHDELTATGTKAPSWAPRFDGMFSDYVIPRTENFNPENPSGVSWFKTLPRLNDSVVAYNDEFQRARMRSLQAVDEMIGDLVQKLDDGGVLDNTYIFFTTDNGFHISQHRTLPGKMCAIEEDINIPMIIRGPGIPEGQVADTVVSSHTDVAPTILKLAGAPLRDDFDGSPMPLTSDELQSSTKSEYVNAEFWGSAHVAGPIQYEEPATLAAISNNTYKAIRIIGGQSEQYNLFYSVWCTNEHEFYDMNTDPGQLVNFFDNPDAASQYQLFGRHFYVVANRLDALLMVLKTCTSTRCREPWSVLHPGSKNITTLEEALSPDYDYIFEAVPKVSFSACKQGYLPEFEGPTIENEGLLALEDLLAISPFWT